jgi:redox-sensing transcriptional repressor
MKKSKASTRSVERLSIYRRALIEHQEELGPHVFSHEIAHHCKLTAAQVRRDLMLVGYNGNPNRGYDVQRLISSIARYLDPSLSREVAILGMGYLGRAIAKFLSGRTPKLHLAAAFDIEPTKVDQSFTGVTCYTLERMPEIVREKHIDLGILTVPASAAQEAAMKMVASGITGILNFAPVVLHVPSHVYVESIDMSVALGKVAFFAPSGSIRRKRAQPSFQILEQALAG